MNYVVIGYPLSHTLSPLIHEANFKALNMNDSYQALEIAPESLETIKAVAAESELNGFNVTVPHKEEIMQYMDDIAPEAKKIGAVNTVHIVDGKYYGYNTDVTGYEGFNSAFGQAERRVLILGAGGAAKAVHRAHADNGDDVTIVADGQTVLKLLKVMILQQC